MDALGGIFTGEKYLTNISLMLINTNQVLILCITVVSHLRDSPTKKCVRLLFGMFWSKLGFATAICEREGLSM
jgi:hypothetical protein